MDDASIRVLVKSPEFGVLHDAYSNHLRLPTDERFELYVVDERLEMVWNLVAVAEFEIRGAVEIDLAELVGID